MTHRQPRQTLTRDRVLEGAVELADEIGIEAFTIRRLAAALDVKPMTIYHYVRLEGGDHRRHGRARLRRDRAADPRTSTGRRPSAAAASRPERCCSRHPVGSTADGVATTPGPGDAPPSRRGARAACAGAACRSQLTAHAYAVIDSYVYGFALQEANLPAVAAARSWRWPRTSSRTRRRLPRPRRVHDRAWVLQPGYHFGDSFEFGLDLILDGLDRAASSASEQSL